MAFNGSHRERLRRGSEAVQDRRAFEQPQRIAPLFFHGRRSRRLTNPIVWC